MASAVSAGRPGAKATASPDRPPGQAEEARRGALLIEIESLSARLAAILDARPHLGALWHRLAALSEAGSSLSLETLSVSPADILRPGLGLGPGRSEPQSMRCAQSIYRALLNPGLLETDPEAALLRAVDVTRLTDILDEERGGRVAYAEREFPEMWQKAGARFSEGLKALGRPGSTLLGALGAARIAAATLPERLPMAERMIFTMAEHGFRKQDCLSSPLAAERIEGLESRVRAHWVLTPSAALAQGGLRSWQPGSKDGVAILTQRLREVLGREIGRLGPLVAWDERMAREMQGLNRKSRKTDLADLIRRTPILNAHLVAEALGVTERAARGLLLETEEAGLLRVITPRRSYRLWAIPALADNLHDRPTARAVATDPAPFPAEDGGGAGAEPGADDAAFEERVSDILGEIDTAMSNIDRLLAGYRHGRPGQGAEQDEDDLSEAPW